MSLHTQCAQATNNEDYFCPSVLLPSQRLLLYIHNFVQVKSRWSCGLTRWSAVGDLAEGMHVRLLCLFCVVQVAASAMSRSLVKSSHTGCVCVPLCVI